jgi:hypothetical protein
MSKKAKLLQEREERILATFHENNRKLNENLDEEIRLVNESQYDDLFNFVEQNPQKGSSATVLYTNLVAMNKNIVNPETGEKSPNPMWGKVYKHQRFIFQWEDTYQRAVERDNPEHEFGARSGTYEKIEGYDMFETGKSGIYLPIVPTGTEAAYSVEDESGNHRPASKEELAPYFKPYKAGAPRSGKNFRPLIVDKIYAINSGGNTWKNPHYQFGQYMGPGA